MLPLFWLRGKNPEADRTDKNVFLTFGTMTRLKFVVQQLLTTVEGS